MPNDAKLGLVLGIGLVVMIGMVYFRADSPARGAIPPPPTAATSEIPSPTADIPVLAPDSN
jgi:hypothetical protein